MLSPQQLRVLEKVIIGLQLIISLQPSVLVYDIVL